jgi:segregation and condensation protein B
MSDEPNEDARDTPPPPAETVVTEADAVIPEPPADDDAPAAPLTDAEVASNAAEAAADGVTEPPPAEDLNDADVEIAPPTGAELRGVVEALVWASPEPITMLRLAQLLEGVPKSEITRAVEDLRADYAQEGRGLRLIEVAGGFQITTRPEHHDWLRQLLDPKSIPKLSIKALETLAVIAYKQPITQPEIIDLRGVKSGSVVKTLLERGLIKIVGRKDVVGRPMLYGTTKKFLDQFELKNLSELPKIEEFAEVLGEEVDVLGLKRALEAPRPVDVPLSEAEATSPEEAPPSADAPAPEASDPDEPAGTE